MEKCTQSGGKTFTSTKSFPGLKSEDTKIAKCLKHFFRAGGSSSRNQCQLMEIQKVLIAWHYLNYPTLVDWRDARDDQHMASECQATLESKASLYKKWTSPKRVNKQKFCMLFFQQLVKGQKQTLKLNRSCGFSGPPLYPFS